FGSPCQRTFVGRSAHIDMGDNGVTVEMGEPGAAGRPLPQNAGRRGSLDDRVGEPPLSHEIPPGRRIGPNRLSLGPAFGDGPVRVVSAPCPVDWREARRQSSEFAQALADVAEAQAWLEPLHQSKDVAFGVAGRIPPSASGVADDQDFAFASPVLQAESRALLPIQFPRRRGSFQHRGAMHLVAQFLDFRVVSGHVCSSRVSAGAGPSGLGLVSAPAPPPDREAGALQGRAERAGACDAPLAARPAPAVAIPSPSLLTRRLSGDGANKKFGPYRGVRRPAAANEPAAITLVGARAETVAAPRRYLRRRRELSFSSTSHGGLALSSTVAQLTPARSSSTSFRGSFIDLSSDWHRAALSRLSMPSCVRRPAAPRGARDARARGTRGSLRRTLASTAAIAVGAPWPLVHFLWLLAVCDEPSERGDGAKN